MLVMPFFSRSGVLNLQCEARSGVEAVPVIRVSSNIALRLKVTWGAGCSAVVSVAADSKDVVLTLN